MHRIHVLAACQAEVRATIPRLVDIFIPREFKKSEVIYVQRAEQLIGMADVVIVELSGWKTKLKGFEDQAIGFQLDILKGKGYITMWLVEYDYRRG